MHQRAHGHLSIEAYAAKAAKSPLEKFEYVPEPIGPWDVEIEIECCGICHSDLHLIDNDWGTSTYPLVPGHEIIGTIHEKGAMVQNLRIGQRVGVGWQRGACLSCEFCIRGDEHLCRSSQATCVGHFGGFAHEIRLDSRFVFPIPDALDSEAAAPLLCGGITVYAPLAEHVRPAMRVGVIGIGGLGHMALQFARAYGCEVTAFSTSREKEKEARSLGAHKFIVSTDKAAMQAAEGTLDFILSTVNVDLDWNSYVEILRPDGNLCIVGASPGPINVPVFSLLTGRKKITSSPIGNRTRIREMLEFAARHKIGAKVETLPLAEANAALAKVRENRARYRIVLKTH